MRSHRGGHPKDKVQTMISTDVKILAGSPVWRENPFLNTTATQLGRGLSDGGCTQIQG